MTADKLFSGSYYDGEHNVACPVCSSDYTHISRVYTRLGTDEHEAGVYDGTQVGGKKASRRTPWSWSSTASAATSSIWSSNSTRGSISWTWKSLHRTKSIPSITRKSTATRKTRKKGDMDEQQVSRALRLIADRMESSFDRTLAEMKKHFLDKTAGYIDYQTDLFIDHLQDVARRHAEGMKVAVQEYVEELFREVMEK